MCVCVCVCVCVLKGESCACPRCCHGNSNGCRVWGHSNMSCLDTNGSPSTHWINYNITIYRGSQPIKVRLISLSLSLSLSLYLNIPYAMVGLRFVGPNSTTFLLNMASLISASPTTTDISLLTRNSTSTSQCLRSTFHLNP